MKVKHLIPCVLAILSVLLLSGCGEQENPTRTSLEADTSTLTLFVGESAFRAATTKAEHYRITYTSSNPAVATVDRMGKVTGVSEGDAVITIDMAESIEDWYAPKKLTYNVVVVKKPVSDETTAAVPAPVPAPTPAPAPAPVLDLGVALNSASVGMFVGANGKAYTSKDAATSSGTTAEAWIAYKSATVGESLAFALTNDAPGGTSWNAFNTSPGWANPPSRTAITGGTWRWPSKTDLDNMLAGFGTLSATDNGVTSNDAPSYWSCTAFDTYNAWSLDFSPPFYLNVSSASPKDSPLSSRYVRAVLAF